MSVDYRQVKLVSNNVHLTCWLPVDRRIRPDVRLTLKGEPETWTVERVYETVLPREALEMGWRVGGLP